MWRHLISLGVLTSATSVAATEPPPVSAYTNPPALDYVRLSPGGDRILMLRPVEGVRHLFVANVASGTIAMAVETDPRDQILRGCEWATNDRAVCRAFVFPPPPLPVVERPGGGVFPHTYLVRLFAVDHDGGAGVDLVPKRRGGTDWLEEAEHQIVGMLPDDPDHILVAVARRDVYIDKGVYRQNIRRNRWTPVVGKQEGVVKWTADRRGLRLIGVGGWRWSRPGDGPTAVTIGPDREVRRIDTLHLSGPERAWIPRVVGFSDDGLAAYLEARVEAADRVALWEVDAVTLRPMRLLADDPDYDILATAIEGRDCGVVGFAHHRGAKAFTWLDTAFGEMIGRLDEAVPGEIRFVPSMSADCARLVVATLGGGRSKTYYLHDRHEGWTRRLGSQYPALDGAWVLEQERTRYRASDGTELAASLTIPPGRSLGPQPLVVLTRGGAVPHDARRFDPWPHFLAGRGYIVLEPEFRGSAGRGIDFRTAGWRDWSATMQRDVWDGVDWLVGRNIADPERVCVMGRGFGAQWALTASFADSRTRCTAVFVAAEAATSDLLATHGSHDLYGARLWWWSTGHLERVAGRYFDLKSARLRAFGWARTDWRETVRSPLVGADHPGFPVLVSKDTHRHRVHERQTGRFRSQLKSIVEVHTRVAQRGGEHETAFIQQAEYLLERELSRPEKEPTGDARLQPISD
ncbi:MAG: prolyl oligopeptidase family serine peptidase [Gammaproteobacteria bacterium]|nr:prolyl oligopeptidase family serine peptidase [Gammaproteobacteria bacterium]